MNLTDWRGQPNTGLVEYKFGRIQDGSLWLGLASRVCEALRTTLAGPEFIISCLEITNKI